MRTVHRKNFTLVELLAAMAVFTVLLLVSMRLFSGSQRMWVRAEQKTNTFADARTAMEFVAARLQTLVYFELVPFRMKENEIWFASGYPVKDSHTENESKQANRFFLKFFKFTRDTDGTLTMRIYSDRGGGERKKFPLLFPPYDADTYNEASAIASGKRSTIAGKLASAPARVIARNVTDFAVYGYFAEVGGNGAWSLKRQNVVSSGAYKKDSGYFTTPPYLVEVSITMLDSADSYEKWTNAANQSAKDEIVREYGYTFRRAVLLGQRSLDE